MKKLLTFLTLFTLFCGVGWAAEVTDTWTATSGALGSGIGTGTITTTGGKTWNYQRYLTSGSSYTGWTNNCIQLGKNGGVEEITFSTSAYGTATIKSVSVECSSYNAAHKVSITVGGTTYLAPTATSKWTTIEAKTGTGTSSGEIVIDFTDGSRALYIKSITVTYETGGTTTYSLTLPTGLTGGTVTSNYSGDLTKIASGTSITVTATPATGYTLEWMKANGSEVQNPYTFAIAENTTITAAFTAAQTYAITVTNGTANPTSAYEGQTVTLTPTIPDGKVVDWNNTTVSPSTLEINHSDYTFTMPNQAVSVAFAFKDTPVQSNIFQRINSTSQLEAGKRYLLVYETKPAVMGGIEGSGSTIHGASVESGFTIANGVITLNANSDAKPLTLGGSSGSWTFDLDGALLNHTSGNSLNTGTSNTTWTIAFSGNNATITNATNTTRVIKYNTGSPRFACYESGQQSIQLYKEVESTPQSSDVYIVGQINGHDSDPWNTSEGVQLTYNSSTDTYGADIYCTGMKNNEDNGYSYFLFAKSLPFSWDVTSNLYGSGADGSYWPISGLSGESAFDEEIPLYDGSKNVYRLPAGLYTVTVDLDYTGHEYTTKSVKVTKRDVTLNVTNSATFTETKNVTMTSNLTELGGKIYYTTNGNDPRDQYSGRQEYTEQLTLDATTTIKAVAVLGCIYSDVVEKTYTKTPAAPVIDPASCTFNEPLTVTITAESGATIYYTTDDSDPKDSETRILYNDAFTVSGATTTVKARAFVGEAYSNIATATYTYSNVQPSTGDFVLVTSADQLVAGNEYIIMSSYEDDWEDVYNVAFGSISSSSGTSLSSGFTVNGNIGTSGSTISLADGSGVNVLTLGGTTGSWNLKQSDDKYIVLPASDTKLSTNTSPCSLVITIGNDYAANIQNSETTDTRQLRYYITSDYFRNYLTSQGKTKDVFLYTRASNAVQNPVFSPVPGIYNVDIDVTISCATDGATIYYTTDGTDPTATTGTQYTGEIMVSESTTFKAIAVKDGNTSSVVTAEYTIQKSTTIETVTLTYREPFTQGIGDFTINNVSGFSPVWSLDGNYGVKGTSYSNGTNYAAVSRLVSPIIDMTGSVQPELSFSHQINKYFTDPTTQCQVFIRETSNGTSGTWVQIPITFSDPVAAGGWTNDVVDIDLTDINGVSYADKKVQISFLYTNPTAGTGAGTWEIQNFVVADNSEYRMVNNIAEFLALENGTKAKFKNPVTVLYDYAQYSSNSYHEYIWVKDNSGYMQFYIIPTLNSDEDSQYDAKAAYYENGDIIPAGFVVSKNYYENGKFVQAYSTDALNAGFAPATQKGLADPEYMDFDVLNTLDATDNDDVATWCNHYITLEKIKLTSSSKNFNFKDENGNQNACVGYNKYNGDGSLLKDGVTSADVDMSTLDLTKFYNVKGIIQLWQGGWEFMPIEFTEWAADEVTLRKLCADGVETHEYKISNNVMGVYASGNSLWVKDDTGQSIHETEPAANDQSYYIDAQGNTREEQANYDQSNWCELVLTSGNAGDFVNKIIKGGAIQGTFANKTNPKMTGVSLVSDDDDSDIYAEGSYAPNYYCMANFLDHTGDYLSQQGNDRNNYFFMNPKPQEYATITWAMWNNGMFVIPESDHYTDDNGTHYINYWDFNGAVSANWSLNTVGENGAAVDQSSALNNYPNGVFEFNAIIRVEDYTPPTSNGAPRLANNQINSKDDQKLYVSRNIVIYPTNLNLSGNGNVITAVNDVKAAGEVESVTYFNVAGMQSSKPFDGINIVVTRYTDGTASTTKVVK